MMKQSEIYLKLLRWGIFGSLLVPLIIFSQYLSPFHFGKAVIFRSLVEIMAVIYILLIITNSKYLPRWSLITISFTIFTGLFVLTSFTAADFTYAFWGTLERMGGLFSFLHFWVFFIILISVFRTRKDWEKLLKISIFVGLLSILFAYGQHFKLGNFFVGWQHGERVIGTIGNPALFSGYLLFIFFLSIYFILKRKTVLWERIFAGIVLILGLPILHITAVRGSVIAFWGGLFLLGLVYLFLLKNRKIKALVTVGLIVVLLITGFIWLNKDQAWVKNSSWLNRMTSISLKASTVETRLWSWRSGWLGFIERPILGWGPENFVLAHAKHFDPRHFAGIGSETIWDRAHNTVLDALTTMGIFGLLSYLSIFGAVFYLLIERFKKKRIELADIGVLGAGIIAYFVHNFFIFDTTANYFVFFLILGYINFITEKKESVIEKIEEGAAEAGKKIFRQRKINPIFIIALLILASILIYKTNIEPARANFACTRAILAGKASNNQEALNKYKEALSYKSPQGKYEIRHKLATFIIQYSAHIKQKENKIIPEILYYGIEETRKNIETHPLDYIPYLYVGRMYIMLIEKEPKLAGEQAEAAVMGALMLNDKNPRVWYELGQARLSQKKYNGAVEAFKRAYELGPGVKESNWFLGMAYAKAGNIEEAVRYIDRALEMGFSYANSINDILRLIELYNRVLDYDKIIKLYKAAIGEQPDNPQFYASLAATYKKIGDIENAILYAQKAAEVDPRFASESEAFINSLK